MGAQRSLGAIICYYSAFAVWLMALASIFSRLSGVGLSFRGFDIPVEWIFPAMMALGGLELMAMGWIGNRPVVRRKPWLWLPIIVGALIVAFGLFVLYLALLRL